MWGLWVVGALAGETSIEGSKEPHGSLTVHAGLSAGYFDGQFAPVLDMGLEVSRELGARRRHVVLLDTDLLLSDGYQHQRLSLGYDLRSHGKVFQVAVGPRLWGAVLLLDGEEAATSPGLSLNTEITIPLGRRWALQSELEGGRATGAAWGTLDPLPLTHLRATTGLLSPVGLGIGVGIQQLGGAQSGLLTIGAGF